MIAEVISDVTGVGATFGVVAATVSVLRSGSKYMEKAANWCVFCAVCAAIGVIAELFVDDGVPIVPGIVAVVALVFGIAMHEIAATLQRRERERGAK